MGGELKRTTEDKIDALKKVLWGIGVRQICVKGNIWHIREYSYRWVTR